MRALPASPPAAPAGARTVSVSALFMEEAIDGI
jgi:hypothetical protein